MRSGTAGLMTTTLVAPCSTTLVLTASAQDAEPPRLVPPEMFAVPEGLEVTLWAATPLLRNPTNIDIDRDGRIWVAEGVRYRSHFARQPEGDRIIVLQDTNGDGKADSVHTFVPSEFMRAVNPPTYTCPSSLGFPAKAAGSCGYLNGPEEVGR